MRRFIAIIVLGGLLLAGCGETTKHHATQQQQVAKHASKQRAYLPTRDVELRNYNDAQKVYDDPTNIMWCTFSFNNASSPLVTVPVAGKLTSSSTTFFSPVTRDGYALPTRSVDGLFHPNPPQYRYGFTPAGSYVDFFNLETYCSNKPTKFQRQATKLSLEVDPGLGAADKSAQAALKAGHKQEAQRIIEKAIGDNG